MSEKYSKEDIRNIAEDLVEELRECEDGTIISTSELAKQAGYDDLDLEDLFALHDVLFRAARRNKIKLDMSAHDGMVEGLPFNLQFVVRNKKAQIRCPKCGSPNTARYLYGYPVFNERMQKKIDTGKLVLGGCCIHAQMINGQYVNLMPARYCNECHKDFGTPPVLVTPKKNTAEFYRDIVRSIKFSIEAYRGGETEVTITRNEDGASVKAFQFPDVLNTPEDKEITEQKWFKIVDKLYGKLYLHEWKKEYTPTDIFEDGEYWNLTVKLTNGRVRRYNGSNAYPPYWNELKKIFREFANNK